MTRSDVSTYSSSSRDDPEADVVHAGAAVFLRHRAAEQPHVRHLREDVLVEPVLSIELADPRRHFTGGPLPDGVLEKLVLIGEIEINHEYVLRRK